MDSVAVLNADPGQAPVIQNLIQLYTHDFSEFWGGTSRGNLNAAGLIRCIPLGAVLVHAAVVGDADLLRSRAGGILPRQ